MKKIMIIVLMCCLLVVGMAGIVGAASSDSPMFKVNGKLFVTPKGEPAPYVNKDARTMGSLRLIASALGVESKNIKWNTSTNTATLVRGTNTVSVVVGKKEMTVNGKKVVMDTVAEMKQGRVFIPARFIAQGLGVKIGYESAMGTVLFYTGEVAKHNFEDYGLTPVVDLPLVLKHNGLKLTVHEAYVYSTKDAEALALQEKYKFWEYEKAYYLLWVKVTLENTSNKTRMTDYRDMLMKISAMNSEGNSMNYTASLDKKQNKMNNTEILFDWVLEPGESVTSYVPFLAIKNKNLDFVGIGVGDGSGSDYSDLAERK